MFVTQRSLKSRFQAIFTSVLLTAPPSFADRLEILLKSVINDSLSNLKLINEIDLTIVAIAIAAYWHQDLPEMRSRILDLQNYYKADIQELVLAYAIAYACREELQPRLFINQICDDFNQRRSLSRDPQSQKYCLDQLKFAQEFVDQGASASYAHTSGLSEAIASSLYYFLSTPHSWSIISDRAQKPWLSNHQQVIVQSGAIAAAYLGEIGNLDQHNQEILTKGKVIGDRLWSEWAGVFDAKLDN
jgi:hypothetical protein